MVLNKLVAEGKYDFIDNLRDKIEQDKHIMSGVIGTAYTRQGNSLYFDAKISNKNRDVSFAIFENNTNKVLVKGSSLNFNDITGDYKIEKDEIIVPKKTDDIIAAIIKILKVLG